jgi:hypothetical protein
MELGLSVSFGHSGVFRIDPRQVGTDNDLAAFDVRLDW